MSSWFHKETPKEAMRKNERELRKTNRGVDKERRDLERQEKQLEMEIKKMAKTGNKEALGVLAKQLINVRKQKTRTYNMNAKITAVNGQQKSMMSQQRMAGAMATTAKTMGQMNKQMDPQKVAKTMQDFEKQSTLMDMGEEMINDTLESIMDDSGDEAESDAIVTQVLDEIGLDISGKLKEAPSVSREPLGGTSKAKGLSDADLEKMLAGLKQ